MLAQQFANLQSTQCQLLDALAAITNYASHDDDFGGRRRGRGHGHRPHQNFTSPSDHSDDEETETVDNPFADMTQNDKPRDDNQHWESSFRMDLPEFTGGLQAEKFLDCLASVDEVFDFKEVPDAWRVQLAATRLRGRAAAWWQQLKQARAHQGKPKITSW